MIATTSSLQTPFPVVRKVMLGMPVGNARIALSLTSVMSDILTHGLTGWVVLYGFVVRSVGYLTAFGA